MISSLLLSVSALCFVATYFFERPSQARQPLEIETYYVCDPESLPNYERAAALTAMASQSCD